MADQYNQSKRYFTNSSAGDHLQAASERPTRVLRAASETTIMPQVKTGRQPSSSSRSSQNKAPKRQPFLHPFAIFIVLVALWVSALPFIAGALYDRVYTDRIYLGVSVMGNDLGGLTRDQASAVLAQNYNRYAGRPLTIHWRAEDGTGRDWTVTPADLGLQANMQQLVDQAYSIGRGQDAIQDWREKLALLMYGDQSIAPTFTIDTNQQASLLQRIAGEVNRPAVNASIKVQPDVTVKIIPGQIGRAVDVPATLAEIQKSFRDSAEPVPSAADINLVVKEVQPDISENDLQTAKQDAEKMLSAPLTVQFQNSSWSLDRGNLASLVTFQETRQPGATKPQVTAVLNQDNLTNWVAGIAKTINRAPRDARLNWNGGNLTVIPGYESRDGYTVDVPNAVKALNDAARTGTRTLALPVITVKAKVDTSNLQQLGIKELVSTGQTSYAGSIPERTKNVRLAASRLNGVVVPPGATFSFNRELGPVTKEAGYEMGFAIIGPDTVPDVGGGVCQIATTLFQSVFWGGYEVLDRYPHPYAIERYEQPPSGRPGLDASVSDYLDFTWKNNSPYYVLIQSRDDQAAQKVSFELYSTKPGWQVSIDGPTVTNVVKADPTIINQTTAAMQKGRTVQVESARDGYDVTIVRTVKKGNDVVSQEKFTSHYRPERNVVLTGTGQ